MKACFGALETRIPAESSRFALQMRAFGPASHLGAGGTSRLLLLMILTFAARSANFARTNTIEPSSIILKRGLEIRLAAGIVYENPRSRGYLHLWIPKE
jgi:hypothetical protein